MKGSLFATLQGALGAMAYEKYAYFERHGKPGDCHTLDGCGKVGKGNWVPDPSTIVFPADHYRRGNSWDLCVGSHHCGPQDTLGKVNFGFKDDALVLDFERIDRYKYEDVVIHIQREGPPTNQSPVYSIGGGQCIPQKGCKEVKCHIPYFSLTDGGGSKEMCPIDGKGSWVFYIQIEVIISHGHKKYELYNRGAKHDICWFDLSYCCAECPDCKPDCHGHHCHNRPKKLEHKRDETWGYNSPEGGDRYRYEEKECCYDMYYHHHHDHLHHHKKPPCYKDNCRKKLLQEGGYSAEKTSLDQKSEIEHKSEEHKSEGPKLEEHKSEEHKSEEYKSDEHKSEGPELDEDKSEEYKSEGPELEEHKPEEHKSEVNNKAEVHDTKPEVNDNKPEVPDTKTEVNDNKPEVHDTKTEVHDTKPEVHDTKPEVHDTKPEVHDTKPEVHDTKPEVHDTKPEVHDTKPEVHDTKPEVHDTKPAAQETKPKIAARNEERDHFYHGHKKDCAGVVVGAWGADGRATHHLSELAQSSHPNTCHNHQGYFLQYCRADLEATVSGLIGHGHDVYGRYFIELDKTRHETEILVAVEVEDKHKHVVTEIAVFIGCDGGCDSTERPNICLPETYETIAVEEKGFGNLDLAIKDTFKCHDDYFIAIFVEICHVHDRGHCHKCKVHV